MATLEDFREWGKYFVAPIRRSWDAWIDLLKTLTGGGIEGPFYWSTNTTVSDPGNTYIKGDNASPVNITKLCVSETDADSTSARQILANIKEGDEVTVQSDSTATFYSFEVTADPTDEGGWWSIPVSHVDASGTTFLLDEAVSFVAVYVEGTFINLRDTPNDYVGERGSFPIVNPDEDGLLFSPYFVENKDPTGFVLGREKVNIEIYDNGGSAYFRITAKTPTYSSYQLYIYGRRYNLTSDQIDISSYISTAGTYYIVYNEDAELEVLTSASFYDIIKDNAFVAEILSNGTECFLMSESHGLMPWQTHYQQHLDGGTVYESGLGLEDVVADGSASDDTSAQFGSALGTILDEDIRHSIAQIDSTTGSWWTMFMKGSAPLWNMQNSGANAPSPVVFEETLNTYPAYNEFTGGAWQLTPVTLNRYFLIHIFASNFVQKYTISTGVAETVGGSIAILGQNQYLTKANAREGAATEIGSLVTTYLPMPEFIAVATVIFQYQNGGSYNARVVSTDEGDDYVSWLGSVITPGSAPSAHPNLTQRNADYQHYFSSIYDPTSPGLLSLDDLLSYETISGPINVIGIGSSTIQNYLRGGTMVDGSIQSVDAATQQVYHEILSAGDANFCKAGGGVLKENGVEVSKTGHTHLEADITDLGDYLPISAGSGNPLTGDLHITHGPIGGVVIGSGSNVGYIYYGYNAITLTASTTTIADINLNPDPESTSAASVTLFKGTNTSGLVKLKIYKGDGTSTIQHEIDAGTGDADFCINGGTLTSGGVSVSLVGHTHVEADITDLDHTDPDAIHDNVSAEISALTEKTTPADADLVVIEDSAASYAKKKVQLGNLPGGGGSVSKSIIDLYKGASSSQSLTTTLADITWDTERYKDGDDFIHTAASAEVEFDFDGRVAIHVDITTDTVNTTRDESEFYLYWDQGSGYAVVPGTYAVNYNRTLGRGENTCSINIILNVSDGDKIKVQGKSSVTGVSTSDNGCRLTCEKLTETAATSYNDDDAIHDNVAGEINALTQVAPATTDQVLIEDASDSFNKKRVTVQGILNIGATDSAAIHDNVASEISAITEKTTPVAADLLIIEDSAASNAKKKVQVGNLLPDVGSIDVVYEGPYNINLTSYITVLDESGVFQLQAVWFEMNTALAARTVTCKVTIDGTEFLVETATTSTTVGEVIRMVGPNCSVYQGPYYSTTALKVEMKLSQALSGYVYGYAVAQEIG